jgi:hypothetical protein
MASRILSVLVFFFFFFWETKRATTPCKKRELEYRWWVLKSSTAHHMCSRTTSSRVSRFQGPGFNAGTFSSHSAIFVFVSFFPEGANFSLGSTCCKLSCCIRL